MRRPEAQPGGLAGGRGPGELRPAAVLVQAVGGGELSVVVFLLEQGVRVRVASKEQVRAFAATAGAGLSGAPAVAEMAGSTQLLKGWMRLQGEDDERVRLLLARRRQVLEMQAQEEERLRVAEYGPIQEDLERHLFFLGRQLGGLHEGLLYLVQVVLPHWPWVCLFPLSLAGGAFGGELRLLLS